MTRRVNMAEATRTDDYEAPRIEERAELPHRPLIGLNSEFPM
jgi:hypothetical protein